MSSSINCLLNRESIETQIVHILQSFDSQCKNIQFKKGIYLYGASGSGKTFFIQEILKKLNYDVISYDAGDTRNKNLIDSITSNNMSNNNVLNMMYKKKQKIAILMDEIEAMNSGDKFGITSLIKLIRQKKTKRQKLESQTYNPIICISNYYVDKKIKELMKVCHVFELKTPTEEQIHTVLVHQVPRCVTNHAKMAEYIQGDLRKCFSLIGWTEQYSEEVWTSMMDTFCLKTFNEDSKKITRRILESPIAMEDHSQIINETDRTIVALLWHENVVDCLQQLPIDLKEKLEFYHVLLKNICFADYIDRITFQNQIWQFNEMSSLIKTMYNNKQYHALAAPHKPSNIAEIRFTKILTKYSTEYNNANFVTALCNKMEMDRKDVMSFFQEMRFVQSIPDKKQYLQEWMDNAEVTKLDVKRFYRYLDQNDKKDAMVEEEIEDEDNEGEAEEEMLE